MPSFTVGGIDIDVNPDFSRTRRKLLEGIAEQEGRSPQINVEAEPKLTAQFKRRLVALVREASAGVTVGVEATPGLRAGFRRDLIATVREASAGVTMPIEATPALRAGFRKELLALVNEAVAGVRIDIEARPALAAGFRRELRALVDEASAGVRIKVEATAALARGFKLDLREQVAKSSSGVRIKVEAEPVLVKGFRKRAQALVAKVAHVTMKVELEPKLAPTFRSQLRALSKTAASSFQVTVELRTEALTEVRRKLKEAIDKAAAGLFVRVKIEPVVSTTDLRARMRAAIRGLGNPKVPVGANTSTFSKELKAGVVKAVHEASKYARVTASLATGGFKKSLSFMASGLRGIAKLAKLSIIGFAGLATVVAAAGAAGLSSAGDFETAHKSLGILLQDVDKGTLLFKGLQQTAKDTPFELPNLLPLTRQLVVIRNTLGDKNFSFDRILPSVQTITDAAAALGATGANVEKVGLALSKVAGRGKVTSEELRSLSKNLPGFSSIQAIATKLGVSVPEAFKAVSAGEVDSVTGINAILEGLKKMPGAAGAAAKLTKETFKGALSNLPDIIRISFFDAFEAQLPKLTKLIQPGGALPVAFEKGAAAVAAPFATLATAIGDLLLKLSPILTHVFTPVIDGAVALLKAVEPLIPAIGSFFDVFAAFLPPLGRALELLGSVLGPVIQTIIIASGPALKAFVAGLVAIVTNVAALLPVLSPLVVLLIQLGGTALKGLASILDAIGPAIISVMPTIIQLADIVAKVITVLGPSIGRFLGSLLQGIVTFATALAPVLLIVAKALTDLLTAIGPSLPALGALLGQLFKVANSLLIAVLPAIGQIVTALLPALKPIGDALVALAPVVGQVIGSIAQAIIPLLKPIGQIIGLIALSLVPVVKALQPVFAAVSDFLLAMAPSIASLVKAAAPAIASLVGLFPLLLKALMPLAPVFADLASEGVFLVRALAPLIPGVVAIVKALLPLINVFAKLGGAVIKTVIGLLVVLARSVSKLLVGLAPFISALVTGLVPIFEALLPSLGKIVPLFAKLLNGAVSRLAPIFVQIAKALQPLLKEMGGQLGRILEELLKALFDLLPGLIDLAVAVLPLVNISVQLMIVGLKILVPVLVIIVRVVGLVATGILNLVSVIARAISTVASFVAKIVTIASDFVSGFIKGIGDKAGAVFSAIGRFFGRIIDWIKGIFGIKSPSTVMAEIGRFLVLGFINGVKSLAGLVLRAFGFLAELPGKFFGWIADVVAKLPGKLLGIAAVIITFLTDLPGKLLGAVGKLVTFATGIGGSILKGIAGGLSGTVGKVLDIGKTLYNSIVGFLNDNVIQKIRDVSVFGGHPFGSFPLIPKLADGGVIARPTVALVGEAGPELVLPLRDRKRMLELLRAAGVLDPVQTGAQVPVPLGVDLKPDQAGADKAKAAVAATFADLGAQLTDATGPGLDQWRKDIALVLDGIEGDVKAKGAQLTRLSHDVWTGLAGETLRIVTGMSRDVRAEFADMLAQLTGSATSGSAGVVGALRTGLDAGTSTVQTIVKGYAVKLAQALNPVLSAIGEKPIDVKAFRRGAVNDPRIVPDGAYNVHVFGERGTKGEAYIPFDPNLRSRSRMIADETVRRLGGQAQWFREGGIAPGRLAQAKTYAQAQVGKPYVWGAVGPDAFDCSGLWSSIVNVVRGQAPNRRLFTSSSLIGAPQDVGVLPGVGQVSIGARRGNPGHVAGTIIGTNFEATPPRVLGGSRARGATAPMFTNQFHLGGGLYLGGNGATYELPPVPTVPRTGALANAGAAVLGYLGRTARGWTDSNTYTSDLTLGKAFEQGAPVGGGPMAEFVRAAIRQAMSITGMPAGWFTGLDTIARRESGYNPLAVNNTDSNALKGTPTKGVMQLLDENFKRFGLPGLGDIFTPLANIVAAIRYILSRYGDISKVQQAHPELPPRGYENGGLITREALIRVAEKNRPEAVIPLTKPKRAMDISDATGLTQMLLDREGAKDGKRFEFAEGAIVLQLTPPAGTDPAAYGSSVKHQIVPALSAALGRL